MASSVHYRLSAAAKLAGLSSHQVRNYLQFGLLQSCQRSEAGHHCFDDECIERLKFIGSAMRAGISIDELRTFLRAKDNGNAELVYTERERLQNRIDVRRNTFVRLAHELKQACEQPALFCVRAQAVSRRMKAD